MANKKPRTPTIHQKEIILNKTKLKEILDNRGLDFLDFHTRIKDDYGLDLSYKGFMSLLSNRSTWKLLYAHVIVTTLGIEYTDIFEIIDVDTEQVKKEKKKFKEKYQK